MQFVVPQFIDIESKIIGPVTPKQFIILIVTAGLIFTCYKLADFTLFIIEAIFLLGLGIVLAFVKVNSQPIYYFFLSLVQIVKKPSLRIWKREEIRVLEKKIREKKGEETKGVITPRRILSSSRLSQVALLVDTGGRYEEESEETEGKAELTQDINN